MKRFAIAAAFALALLPASGASAATVSFAYTGAEQSFTVPATVTNVHVSAIGGRGGNGGGGSGDFCAKGGAASQVSGDLSVTPGQVLYVEVAGNGEPGTDSASGAGGFNGGGGGGSTYFAGGGGGASDVRSSPASAGLAPDRRLLVAAGGGGGGGRCAGSPGSGGPGGSAGADSAQSKGGGAGTESTGGKGGATGGVDGSLAAGGAGGSGNLGSGGGGGAGYFGGGGGGSVTSAEIGAGSGGGGGSSVGGIPGLASANTGPQVQITYDAKPVAPIIATASGLSFSHKTFAAEASGPSAYVVKRKAPRGTKVTFKLNEAAAVRFTVTRRAKGRRVKRGKKTVCVKPTRKNRKHRRCNRVVTLKGSFSRNGVAGTNSFHFTGRLKGRKLRAGKYRLVATPTAGAVKGKATSTGFRIVR